MKKRLVSCILAISMCASICTPAFASNSMDADLFEKNTIIGEESLALVDGEDGYLLTTTDYENGNILFVITNKGEVVEATYVDRASNTIQTIRGNEIFNTQAAPRAQAPQNTAESATPAYSYVGKITYLYGVDSYCGLRLYNDSESDPSTTYDISGTYRGISAFLGFLATLLGYSGSVVSKIGKWVLDALQINAAASVIEIPPLFELEARSTTNYWRIVDVDTPNHVKEFSGAEYIISNQSYGNGTYYGGDAYFTKSDFSNRNLGLSTYCYDEMFAFYPWQVYSWN